MNTRFYIFLSLFCCLQQQISSSEYYNPDKDYHDSFLTIPPPELPETSDSMLFFLGASYTYWQVYQGGMTVATTSIVDPSTTTNPVNWLQPNFKCNSGFKINGSINTTYDGWKVNGLYTFYHSHPSTKVYNLQNDTHNYYSSFIYDENGSQFFYIDALTSRFQNLYQDVRVTIDRPFYSGNNIIITPSFGLISAFETQDFTVSGGGRAVSDELFSSVGSQTKKFNCIGPIGEISTLYYFINHFGLYGSFSSALCLGYHGTEFSFYQEQQSFKSLLSKSKIWKVDPMLQTSLGLQVDYFFNYVGVFFKAGWDLMIWFDHNTFVRSVAYFPFQESVNVFKSVSYENRFGDYALQGLTLNLTFTF